MSMFTTEQLAQLGFEPGVVFYHISEVSLDELLQALGETVVFGPQRQAQEVSLRVSCRYIELFAEIDARGNPGQTWPATSRSRPKNPRAAWIEGTIVGASAMSTPAPQNLRLPAEVVVLAEFNHPSNTPNISWGIWLQLVHNDTNEGQIQLGTAQELLTVLVS